jgi:sporulation-control protein spo0M
MIINLPNPVPVTETQTTETQRTGVDIDFVYADFKADRIVVKVQPWNREVVIEGEAYATIKNAFEAGLAAAFEPAITAALTPAAAPEEEV